MAWSFGGITTGLPISSKMMAEARKAAKLLSPRLTVTVPAERRRDMDRGRGDGREAIRSDRWEGRGEVLHGRGTRASGAGTGAGNVIARGGRGGRVRALARECGTKLVAAPACSVICSMQCRWSMLGECFRWFSKSPSVSVRAGSHYSPHLFLTASGRGCKVLCRPLSKALCSVKGF